MMRVTFLLPVPAARRFFTGSRSWRGSGPVVDLQEHLSLEYAAVTEKWTLVPEASIALFNCYT